MKLSKLTDLELLELRRLQRRLSLAVYELLGTKEGATDDNCHILLTADSAINRIDEELERRRSEPSSKP